MVVFINYSNTQRKLVEEDLLPVELDDRPGCDIRLVKRVVDNCKQKVYDRINVRTCVHYF